MKRLRACAVCKKYTLQLVHCNRGTVSAYPAPFNPRDPYGDYRRKAKGLLVVTAIAQNR